MPLEITEFDCAVDLDADFCRAVGLGNAQQRVSANGAKGNPESPRVYDKPSQNETIDGVWQEVGCGGESREVGDTGLEPVTSSV